MHCLHERRWLGLPGRGEEVRQGRGAGADVFGVGLDPVPGAVVGREIDIFRFMAEGKEGLEAVGGELGAGEVDDGVVAGATHCEQGALFVVVPGHYLRESGVPGAVLGGASRGSERRAAPLCGLLVAEEARTIGGGLLLAIATQATKTEATRSYSSAKEPLKSPAPFAENCPPAHDPPLVW
jgi:hypothetical protein